MPDKYDGKSKGPVARQFWTRCQTYAKLHADEFLDEDKQMQWILMFVATQSMRGEVKRQAGDIRVKVTSDKKERASR